MGQVRSRGISRGEGGRGLQRGVRSSRTQLQRRGGMTAPAFCFVGWVSEAQPTTCRSRETDVGGLRLRLTHPPIPTVVIASEAKQSRILPRRQSGSLRRK